MGLNLANTVLAISVTFVIGGCSMKKEVVAFNNDPAKQQIFIEKDNLSNTTNDDKLPKSDNDSIGDNIISTTTDGQNQNSKVVDNLYNTTTSQINGENVVLKSIHFDFDMYTLTEENLQISAENSTIINNVSKKDASFKIKLEGNCDEWGTDEYNYALSLKRTSAVKSDLINRGISPDRIVTLSYGESNPICKEQTAECWAKNRRVDHYLVP